MSHGAIVASLQPTVGGWVCLSVVVLFPILVVITIKLELKRLPKAAKAFMKGRQEMTDEEFVQLMGDAPEFAGFYLTGRRIMADLSGIPAEIIRPWDTVRALLDLQFDNGYIQDFLFELEIQMGKFDPPNYYPDNTRMFGDWLKDLAADWKPQATSANLDCLVWKK